MIIFNYLLIGFIFTFLVDVIMGSKGIQNPPSVKKAMKKGAMWGNRERIFCILIWPITISIFLWSFFKEYFKKH